MSVCTENFYEDHIEIVGAYLSPNSNNMNILNYEPRKTFVCVTGLRAVKYDQMMRWWSSNLGQGLLQPYIMLLIIVYPYPAYPATLLFALATSRGHFPTRSSHFSIPEKNVCNVTNIKIHIPKKCESFSSTCT